MSLGYQIKGGGQNVCMLRGMRGESKPRGLITTVSLSDKPCAGRCSPFLTRGVVQDRKR